MRSVWPTEIKMFLTKDGDGHPAGSDRSAHYVGNGTLIGAAVLRGGPRDAEDVDDPIWKSLFHLNCLRSLWGGRERQYGMAAEWNKANLTQDCP